MHTQIQEPIAKDLKTLNVLFVDDEKTIHDMMTHIMPKLCKRTFFAQNGVEGLSLAIKYKIDMVITDISMPTMNGFEMVRSILKFHPHVKIIFITGQSNPDLSQVPNKNCQLLYKPLNTQSLKTAIQNVM
ncbi:MAG: response regulator [Campylobacterota bacterium]